MWSASGQGYNDNWGTHQNGYGHHGMTSSSANYASDPKRPSAYHSQSLPRNVGRRKAGGVGGAARGQQWSQDDFGANYGYHANGTASTWDYGHGRGEEERNHGSWLLRPQVKSQSWAPAFLFRKGILLNDILRCCSVPANVDRSAGVDVCVGVCKLCKSATAFLLPLVPHFFLFPILQSN